MAHTRNRIICEKSPGELPKFQRVNNRNKTAITKQNMIFFC